MKRKSRNFWENAACRAVLLMVLLAAVSGCRNQAGAADVKNTGSGVESSMHARQSASSEPTKKTINVQEQEQAAEEYDSLEEFRSHYQEGIFVLCGDSEMGEPEAGSGNPGTDGGALSFSIQTIRVKESYISVRYDCVYQEDSFDVLIVTERESYRDDLLAHLQQKADNAQPGVVDRENGKDPIIYYGLGRIYGDTFGCWTELEQKPVIIHVEGDNRDRMEHVLKHLEFL